MPHKEIANKFVYKCVDCDAAYNSLKNLYLCPVCSKENNAALPPKGVLKICYTLVSNRLTFQELQDQRYLPLLPIKHLQSLPKLKVGNTPLYEFTELGSKKLPFKLFLKDDSQNPTFSFKDRASALVVAFAKEQGFETIVTASTGNAGSSLAGICAAEKQQAIIMVPETAPLAKLTQIIMYGATLVPVKGTYDDAFDLSIKASETFGWYNRNTAYNPLTIEGKKTVAFEIFAQMQEELPDRIFVPVGDGVILSAVYKGFEDLLKLNLINRIPIIVSVQSKNSDNLNRNIDNSTFEIKPSNTIADSISVDIPRNFNMAKKFIKQYHGEWISVSDDAIIEASTHLSSTTGIFSEPAAAAAFAGFLDYFKANKLDNNSKNLVLLTGSGLKDLNSVQKAIKIPKAIVPDIDNLKNLIS